MHLLDLITATTIPGSLGSIVSEAIIQWSNYLVENIGVFLSLLMILVLSVVVLGVHALRKDLQETREENNELRTKLTNRNLENGRMWFNWQSEQEFCAELLQHHVEREDDIANLETSHRDEIKRLDAYNTTHKTIVAYKRGVNKTVEDLADMFMRGELVFGVKQAVAPFLADGVDQQQLHCSITGAVIPLAKVIGGLRDLQELRN